MKRKTIHLDPNDGYNLRDGVVEYLCPIQGTDDYGYQNTAMRVGARAVLVSITDVSPNALRSGHDSTRYELRFDCPDGVPGNSNRNITRFHGWRGTTNDRSMDAHGVREIVSIRELKNGTIAVTVGPDLAPDVP